MSKFKYQVNYPTAELRGIKIQNLFPCCHSCPCLRRDKLVPAKAGSRNPEFPAKAGIQLLPVVPCFPRGKSGFPLESTP